MGRRRRVDGRGARRAGDDGAPAARARARFCDYLPLMSRETAVAGALHAPSPRRVLARDLWRGVRVCWLPRPVSRLSNAGCWGTRARLLHARVAPRASAPGQRRNPNVGCPNPFMFVSRRNGANANVGCLI